MSAAKHTQGTWHVGSKYPADIYADRAGHAIARAVNPQSEGECEANAKRIVTCVNALDGLSQDALDGGWNFKDQGAYTVRVESQRDDLLKALTDLRDAIEAGKEPALADANRSIRKAGSAL